MTASVTLFKNIPTLGHLYRLGLRASKNPPFTPSASLNDKISIWNGDLTKLKTQAIVHAGTQSLLGKHTLSAALYDAGGKLLLKDTRRLMGVEIAKAKVTRVHDPSMFIAADWIIHTSGPNYYDVRGDAEEDAPRLLRECYVNCMEKAMEVRATSIAFPAISTGRLYYPVDEAADVALEAVRGMLEGYEHKFERVVFCCYRDSVEDAYLKAVSKYFPPTEDQGKASELIAEEASRNLKGCEHRGEKAQAQLREQRQHVQQGGKRQRAQRRGDRQPAQNRGPRYPKQHSPYTDPEEK